MLGLGCMHITYYDFMCASVFNREKGREGRREGERDIFHMLICIGLCVCNFSKTMIIVYVSIFFMKYCLIKKKVMAVHQLAKLSMFRPI